MIKSDKITFFVTATPSTSSRIIGEFTRQNLSVSAIKNLPNGIEFTARKGDIKVIQDIANVYQTDITMTKKHGVARVLDTLKLRGGIILGIVIGIVFAVILSTYALDINIECDDPLYIGKVEQTIRKSGVKVGSPLKSIDKAKVEKAILEAIPESVFATVKTRGIAVYVTVVTTPLTLSPSAQKDKLIATDNGVITRAITRSGTCLVKAGDRVNKGDTLINGYINTNKDPYAKPEEQRLVACPADGEIYAKVYYHKRIYNESNSVLTRRSGKQKMLRELYFGKIPIGKCKKIEYNSYESVTSYSIINILAPINVKTVTYYELEEYTLTPVAYQELRIAQTRADMIDALPRGAKVIREQIIPSQTKALDFYLEVEQRIDDGGYNYSYTRD